MNNDSLNPVIRLKNLKKSFGSKKVLKGINLDIFKGESMVVIGASGTGKSVLVKHVIGLLTPNAGKVIVDGVDISTLDQIQLDLFRRRFGMLFQGGALFDSMNVFENVAFPLMERERGKYTKKEVKNIVFEMLDLVEMREYVDYWPVDLSGGMKKRVGLARALASNPSIMLYDEPTTGLDPVVGGVIDRLITRTRDRFNVTSITITHDMRSAYRIGDRIAMLYKGDKIFDGTPDQIKYCEIPEVKEFVKDRTSHISYLNDADPLTSEYKE